MSMLLTVTAGKFTTDAKHFCLQASDKSQVCMFDFFNINVNNSEHESYSMSWLTTQTQI